MYMRPVTKTRSFTYEFAIVPILKLPILDPPPPLPQEGTVRANLQVGDLARESGKTVRAIHLYEELDLLRPQARSKGRYRLYGPEALVRIRWIGKLQDMGLSLTDIQAVIRDWEMTGSAPRAMDKMRDVYTQKLKETRAQLRRLEALEKEIEASLAYLDACEPCSPDRVVHACPTCNRLDRADAPELVTGFHAQPKTTAVPV